VNKCSCQFEPCFGIPCRHRWVVVYLSAYKGEVACDNFWYKRQHRVSQLVTGTTVTASAALVTTNSSTKLKRRQELMSTFGAVADLACETPKATRDLVSMLTERMKNLTTTSENATHGISTTPPPPTGGQRPPMPSILVANPATTSRKQTQARLQPSGTGPTSKASKRISRDRKKSFKARENEN
jgi:hypothetical protein